MTDHDSLNNPPTDLSGLEAWLVEHKIDEVECLIPDMAGLARGKIVPRRKFIACMRERTLRIAEAVFMLGVTGSEVQGGDIIDPAMIDVVVVPDLSTLRIVPWVKEPVAQVVCDVQWHDESLVDIAPRHVLQRVLQAYDELGLQAVVAPELEFYFVKQNVDPDYPLAPPKDLTGRIASARQAYGVEAMNLFDHVIEDIYDFCEASNININSIVHEGGPCQMEINFSHGDPLALADQVFLFKRTVRQAAFKHDIYATFMAKPHQGESGSSMHIHQSVIETASKRNIFADGEDSEALMHYLGGLQQYVPKSMPFFAPYVNSYRRLTPYFDAPVNSHWGLDNRTVGFRVPHSDQANRRIENRVGGADCNPYLIFAASLGAGLLGLREKKGCQPPVKGDGYRLPSDLPSHLMDSVRQLETSSELHDLLGERFIRAFLAVKMDEHRAHFEVISPWEREFLLLNV